MQLRGRVAVVTDADSAVGQAVAQALAAEGVSLMLIAQPGTHVRGEALELEANHRVRVFPASADVRDREAVDRLVMHAEQHVGAVDIVVNLVPGCLSEALQPTMEQRGHGRIIDLENDAAPATAVEHVLAALRP